MGFIWYIEAETGIIPSVIIGIKVLNIAQSYAEKYFSALSADNWGVGNYMQSQRPQLA